MSPGDHPPGSSLIAIRNQDAGSESGIRNHPSMSYMSTSNRVRVSMTSTVRP